MATHSDRHTLRLAIKRLIGRLPEGLTWRVFDAVRLLTNPESRRRRRRTVAIRQELGLEHIVQSGTFAGMAFGEHVGQGELLPKLLGTYEIELAPVWEKLRSTPPDLVVDIGAAEGYYAVGLARALCRDVVAFEIEPPYHAAIRALARANGLEQRVRVHGECTVASLQGALAGVACPFVLSDCEGAEAMLLDPDEVPALGRARILVELHERLVPGVTDLVLRRFESTHTAELIPTSTRSASQFPFASVLGREAFEFAVDEGRGGPMQWALLEPRPSMADAEY